MLDWISANIATVIICAVLIAVVAAIIVNYGGKKEKR